MVSRVSSNFPNGGHRTKKNMNKRKVNRHRNSVSLYNEYIFNNLRRFGLKPFQRNISLHFSYIVLSGHGADK